MIREDALIQKSANVSSRRLPDRFVLIDQAQGAIYSFTESTYEFWEQIEKRVLFQDLVRQFADGDEELVQEELELFLMQLWSTNLITISTCPTPGAALEAKIPNYYKYCLEKNIIFTILIELTNQCNLHCLHCYHEERSQMLDQDHLHKLFMDLKQMGTVEVVLTGGEVFLRKDIFEIMDLAHHMGFAINLITNMTLLNDSILERLQTKTFVTLKTSLYGCTSDVHDRITGVQGSFDATMRAIQALSLKGRHVTVNYVVLEANCHQVEETAKMLHAMNIEVTFDFKIFPTRLGQENPMHLYVTEKQLTQLVQKGFVQPLQELECYAGKAKVRIDPHGLIYPCEYINFAFGNIMEQSILDVWNSEEMNVFRQHIQNYQPDECMGCLYKPHCLRCPALVWNTNRYANQKHPMMCYQSKVCYHSINGGKIDDLCESPQSCD